MNPKRLMGKMTAKGLLIDGGGLASSGGFIVRSADVAGALGMGKLSQLAYFVGRAKYCDDGQASRYLALWVSQEFRRICLQEGLNEAYCEGLGQLAVLELLWPQHCTKCDGHGVLEPASGWGSPNPVICEKCSGKGAVGFTVRSRAAAASTDSTKISKTHFADVWAERVDRMVARLEGFEQQVLSHLKYQFADEAA